MNGNVVFISCTLLDALDPFDGTYLHGYADPSSPNVLAGQGAPCGWRRASLAPAMR